MRYTKTYKVWERMKLRCYNKNRDRYKNYGGRGIKVCDRWKNSFENFYKDMGDKPEEMTLDRIDNNGDYTPENCRWATHEQQVNNKTDSNYIEINGKKLTVTQWAKKLKVNPKTLFSRLNRGWSKEDTVLIPIK